MNESPGLTSQPAKIPSAMAWAARTTRGDHRHLGRTGRDRRDRAHLLGRHRGLPRRRHLRRPGAAAGAILRGPGSRPARILGGGMGGPRGACRLVDGRDVSAVDDAMGPRRDRLSDCNLQRLLPLLPRAAILRTPVGPAYTFEVGPAYTFSSTCRNSRPPPASAMRFAVRSHRPQTLCEDRDEGGVLNVVSEFRGIKRDPGLSSEE